ncbi:MAG: adenylate/guanylate cyclase domain-containing protein [Deltaproteobacteria bacterium]|nr:MAG: adenylate/guanylate cyclase domain-containing protein [Deltaproteobacteria bacterium]
MSRLSKAMIVGLLTGIMGLLASLASFGLDLEEKVGLDVLFKLRGTREVPPEVVIVTMDKASADHLNLPAEPDKWPRSLNARLINNLIGRSAAAIAFDMIFDEARSPNEDSAFAEAVRKAGNVVLSEIIRKETFPLNGEHGGQKAFVNIERLVPPIAPLRQSAVAIAPFPLPKVPVKVSQYWTFKTSAGDTPTLPVVVFQISVLDLYDEFIQFIKLVSPSKVEKLPAHKQAIMTTRNAEKLVQLLREMFREDPTLGKKMLRELANSEAGPLYARRNKILRSLIRMYQSPNSHYLNFYGPAGTITTVSYYRVLQLDEKHTAPQDPLDFTGKAVFVGLSERMRPEQKDGFYTTFSQSSGVDISGVEIAATAFANLMEDMPVRPLSISGHVATVFFWGLLLGILCRVFPTIVGAASVITLSALYLVIADYQFKYNGSWYPLVVPLGFQTTFAFFGALVWDYFETHKERQNIRDAFGYFLPDNAVDQLAKNLADITSSSQIVYGTCLCTDAEQYTRLSETMDPKELSRFMNRYYQVVFEPIRRRGGIVSDVKGDSVLALWTTAHPDIDLRSQACRAAIDIVSAVHRFNQSSKALQLPTRIGLNAGHMSLGTIGAIDHYEYRAVGDIVNTASRIEGLNKQLGTRILVSEEVLEQIEGFLTRELGEFLLKGKTKPVVVHELLCPKEKADEEQRSLCAIFASALNAYRRQIWEEAMERFRESTKINSDDGPSLFYLNLCEQYRQNPPGESWSGLVRLERK